MVLSFPNYKIFEVLPGGSRLARGYALDIEAAWHSVHETAQHTQNECIAIDVRTCEIVAQLNVMVAALRAKPKIFQIAYTEVLGIVRAEALMIRGYHVETATGNAAAKQALLNWPACDLAILGHNAGRKTRIEMVMWLRARYPKVKVIALNRFDETLSIADFNIRVTAEPERWLQMVGRSIA